MRCGRYVEATNVTGLEFQHTYFFFKDGLEVSCFNKTKPWFFQDQRVPADMVLLRTTEGSGACFIRTDQLDGETDWKLRLAVPPTQRLGADRELFDIAAQVYAEKPQKDIHSFIGTFTRVGDAASLCREAGGAFCVGVSTPMTPNMPP